MQFRGKRLPVNRLVVVKRRLKHGENPRERSNCCAGWIRHREEAVE